MPLVWGFYFRSTFHRSTFQGQRGDGEDGGSTCSHGTPASWLGVWGDISALQTRELRATGSWDGTLVPDPDYHIFPPEILSTPGNTGPAPGARGRMPAGLPALPSSCWPPVGKAL